MNHSLPEVMNCYGGWIYIKNLPLSSWKNSVFEAIGDYLGGLVEISSKTLNWLDCSSTLIEVQNNLCGFIQHILIH